MFILATAFLPGGFLCRMFHSGQDKGQGPIGLCLISHSPMQRKVPLHRAPQQTLDCTSLLFQPSCYVALYMKSSRILACPCISLSCPARDRTALYAESSKTTLTHAHLTDPSREAPAHVRHSSSQPKSPVTHCLPK